MFTPDQILKTNFDSSEHLSSTPHCALCLPAELCTGPKRFSKIPMPVPPGLISIRRRFEGNPFQIQLVKWNEVESSGINRNQVDRFIK